MIAFMTAFMVVLLGGHEKVALINENNFSPLKNFALPKFS